VDRCLREHALRHRLLLVGALFCVGGCLSTEGYYRFQDGGTPGNAGATGTAGNIGTGGTTGSAGSTGVAGTAGSIAPGRGGTTGTAGAAGTTAGRGGTTGAAGRGGTTGSGGTGASAGTTGGGGSGSVLFMDDFEAGISSSKWDFGVAGLPPIMMDGTKVVNVTETAGDQKLGAAGMLNWTNYSVEAKVKVLSFSGTSSSDGVAICARLSGPESFYYLLISPSDTKAMKIKLNNGSNTSLSSSLDSTGFAVNTWVTLRLDVQGNTLTAYLNGTIKGTYTAVDADKILPMGGIGLMVQRANAVFDDVVVRALP
jgi:hypothetical protein